MDTKYLKINIDPEGIVKKYRPLRKIKIPLFYDIVYFPYYVVSIKATLHTILIKNKPLLEYRAVNAVEGNVMSMIGVLKQDSTLEREQQLEYKTYEVEAIFPKQESIEQVSINIQNFWQRKIGGPFRLKLNIDIEEPEVTMVYKPYWVLYTDESLRYEQIMVVDGVSGLAGMYESISIKKVWLSLQSNK